MVLPEGVPAEALIAGEAKAAAKGKAADQPGTGAAIAVYGRLSYRFYTGPWGLPSNLLIY
jgi:hypothetical protein